MPAAEFNVWFDPEAARIVAREPIDQTFIPLDVTNSAKFAPELFDRIKRANPVIARIHVPPSPNPSRPALPYVRLWDQLAFAYAVDPTLATEVQTRWVDVDTAFGLNYGRTMSYTHAASPTPFLQRAKIVMRFDLKRFEDYFVATMSRPLPVQ